ncbi:MAG: ABC transporter ATP-binding protein [Lachnospira sp.]
MAGNNILRKIVAKYSPYLIIAVILSFIVSDLVVIGSGKISNSVNIMAIGEQVDVTNLCFEMGIIILAAMIITFLRSVCNEVFSIEIQKQCKIATIEAIGRAEYGFFNRNSGTLINKLSSDINDMRNLLSEILPDILQYTISIFVMSIAIVKMSWIIFVGVLIIFPTSLYISNKIAKKINELAKKRRGKYDELSEIALDNIEGIEIAKAYGIEEILGKRVKNKANEILQNEYARNRYQALANGVTLIIKWVPTIICSIVTLVLVLKDIISIGELMAFLILLGKITNPISELPFRLIEAKEMIISVKRIQDLISTPPEKSGTYKCMDVNSFSKVFELKNVGFSYNSCLDINVIENISIVIEKGEKIAIVGASGAGKTTLLKILCGFIKITSGDYKLYGTDISEWNIDEVRKIMAYVSQDAYLFPGTIAENVAYGDKAIDMTKVESVCKHAGIYETINTLSDRFDTEVGERGIKLSGGERQRLSIARALYKNAPIILMDEPTSALDEDTQGFVSKMIYGDKDKTVVVIAHRLSTIKDADRIYCMENGKISQCGNHDELMALGGVYASLYGKEVIENEYI